MLINAVSMKSGLEGRNNTSIEKLNLFGPYTSQ